MVPSKTKSALLNDRSIYLSNTSLHLQLRFFYRHYRSDTINTQPTDSFLLRSVSTNPKFRSPPVLIVCCFSPLAFSKLQEVFEVALGTNNKKSQGNHSVVFSFPFGNTGKILPWSVCLPRRARLCCSGVFLSGITATEQSKIEHGESAGSPSGPVRKPKLRHLLNNPLILHH